MPLKTKNSNVREGIFFIAVAAVALIMALGYHIPGNLRLSPALFPIAAALVLSGLAFALLKSADNAEKKEQAAKPGIKTASAVFLLCPAYTAAMGKIGFVPATVVYLLLFLLLLGEKRFFVAFLMPVLVTGSVWLFFAKALSVPLP